jgi:hypothetical protein
MKRDRRDRQHARPSVESLEMRALLSRAAVSTLRDAGTGVAAFVEHVAAQTEQRIHAAAATTADSSGPIVDRGQLPFRIKLTPLNIPGAPALQSAATGQFQGKWLFIGGRTNGLHGFSSGQDFPPEYQNRNIIVIDPKTRHVWSRPWSDSTLSITAIDALTSSNQEADQQGNRLYIIGGYGVDSSTGVSTTFDTLSAINVPGLIRAVIRGGDIAAQVRQIQNPLFQVTGGQLGKLGDREYLVMGQSFLGDYFSSTAVQQYTDQIQSFEIVDKPHALFIRDYQTTTDKLEFHRRDFRMSPVILPKGRPGLEAFGGVFTATGSGYRRMITIVKSGQATVSTYQQYFSQYDAPQIPMYNARDHSMQTVFLGGISLYTYDPTTSTIAEDPMLPFINTISDLVQRADGSDQEYILPVQLPGLLGAGAQSILSPLAPHTPNGVIKLDAIDRPTALGYMYGGILAQQPNNGNSTASAEIFKVTLVPRKAAR